MITAVGDRGQSGPPMLADAIAVPRLVAIDAAARALPAFANAAPEAQPDAG